MPEGRIKWYNEKKGFGFIETETEGDIFLHSSGIEDHGYFTLTKEDRVTFEVKKSHHGVQAVRVRRVKEGLP